jgi:uracil-DNA glycosylase
MDKQPDDQSGTSIKSLRALAAAVEGECTRCPLYRDATQAAVPGEGPKGSDFMLVGER